MCKIERYSNFRLFSISCKVLREMTIKSSLRESISNRRRVD